MMDLLSHGHVFVFSSDQTWRFPRNWRWFRVVNFKRLHWGMFIQHVIHCVREWFPLFLAWLISLHNPVRTRCFKCPLKRHRHWNSSICALFYTVPFAYFGEFSDSRSRGGDGSYSHTFWRRMFLERFECIMHWKLGLHQVQSNWNHDKRCARLRHRSVHIFLTLPIFYLPLGSFENLHWNRRQWFCGHRWKPR